MWFSRHFVISINESQSITDEIIEIHGCPTRSRSQVILPPPTPAPAPSYNRIELRLRANMTPQPCLLPVICILAFSISDNFLTLLSSKRLGVDFTNQALFYMCLINSRKHGVDGTYWNSSQRPGIPGGYSNPFRTNVVMVTQWGFLKIYNFLHELDFFIWIFTLIKK